MKTGKLFEFSIDTLSAALRTAFAAEASPDFNDKAEAQCGCSQTTTRLYVVAETKLQALRAINRRKQGICGGCIAALIAKENWNIVSSGDRF